MKYYLSCFMLGLTVVLSSSSFANTVGEKGGGGGSSPGGDCPSCEATKESQADLKPASLGVSSPDQKKDAQADTAK